ncbi:MAG: sel1 repeat family protein [Campylobacteraceae bacterium]|jgi:hypothetical protein|nr:sel1 repeat family protein [Campylobacteraceae bacterium]
MKKHLFFLVILLFLNGCDAKKDNIDTHKAACETGNISSCNYVAESYERGDNGLKVSYEMAEQYFLKACNMQDAFGCVRVANIYYFGFLGDDNRLASEPYYTKALEYYTKACAKKDMKSCGIVGDIYSDGRGIPKNEFSALSFFEAACDGGEFGYCYRTGSYYIDGKGTSKNITKGLEYWNKACAGAETGYACYEIGKAHYTGEIIPKNMVKAKDFFKKGCERSKFNGCEELKRLDAFGDHLHLVADAEFFIHSFYDINYKIYGDREHVCESKAHNELFLVRCYPKGSNYIGNVFVVEINNTTINGYELKATNEIAFNSLGGLIKRYKKDIPVSELIKIF